MLTSVMHSTDTNGLQGGLKTTKPPPPVPPRPAKSVVQEALAKSRIHQRDLKPRTGPLPPPPTNQPLSEVKKPSPTTKKPAPRVPSPLYDTIEIDKVSARPVVYQSDNLRKPAKTAQDSTKKLVHYIRDELIKKPVTKNESFKINGDVKLGVNRIDSFKNSKSAGNGVHNNFSQSEHDTKQTDTKHSVKNPGKQNSVDKTVLNKVESMERTDSFVNSKSFDYSVNNNVLERRGKQNSVENLVPKKGEVTKRIDSFRNSKSTEKAVKNSDNFQNGDDKKPLNKIESFKNTKHVTKTESFKTTESNAKKPLTKIESFKNVEINNQNIIKLPRVNSFKVEKDDLKNSKKYDRGRKESLDEGLGVEGMRTEILIENGSFDEDSKSQTSTLDKSTISSKDSVISTSSSRGSSIDNHRNWDRMLQDKNHVNTLIDEMFTTAKNDNKIVIPNKMTDNIIINSKSNDNLTVIVISDSSDNSDDNKSFSSGGKSNSSTSERKNKINDTMNHEFLIQELQNMKTNSDKILKRQRLPSLNICSDHSLTGSQVTVNSDSSDKIQTTDWFGLSEEGKEVRMSSCHITIEDAKNDEWEDGRTSRLDFERISKMSQFHGLPPLPKSLSGFSFIDYHPHPNPPTPARSSSIRTAQGGPQLTPSHLGPLAANSPHSKMNGDGKKPSSLDQQLAILRREMYSLRQQDLSLLSQLWSLNESIQDFRQMLQDQEDRVLSPPSPSPTQSSIDDDEEYYMSAQSMGFRPSPMVSRKLSGSSGASGSLG